MVLVLLMGQGILGATEITLSQRDTARPLVNVWLTESRNHEVIRLKPFQDWIELHVERILVPHQEFLYVWKKDGHPWMTENRRLWNETSQQRCWLGGGKEWNLEIQTADGRVLASLDFKKTS